MKFYDRNGNPISLPEWIELLEQNRHIEDTTLGDVRVSTIWLGLDHSFIPAWPPLIFETMVFGGPLDQEMERYSTEEAARAGHARWVEFVATALDIARLDT